MRKKSTRLLSAALAACMMLSVLPVGAFAAEPGTEPENGNGVSAQAEETLPFAGKEITEGGTYTMEGGEYTGPITVNVQDGKDVIINITGHVTTNIRDMLIKVVKGHVTINGGNDAIVENMSEPVFYYGLGAALIGLSSTDDNTTVEINGGTYRKKVEAAVGCENDSKGTLTINSGTFETGMGGAVENVASDSAAVMQIEGGTFIGREPCKDNRGTHALANYGTTIINGGVFQGYGGSAVSQSMGELQIHGGTFELMNPENTVIDIEDGPSKTTITGGYFKNLQGCRWGDVVNYESYMQGAEANELHITGGTFEIEGENVDGIRINNCGSITIENATIRVKATSGRGAGIEKLVDSETALKVKNVTIENAGSSGNFSDILLDNYHQESYLTVDLEITEDFTHKAVVDATDIEEGLQVTTETATSYHQKDLKLVSADPNYIIDYQKNDGGTEYRYFNTREMGKYYVNPINATMTADGEEKRPYSQFAQGDKVTLTANIPEGKQFVDWKVEKIAAEGVEDVSKEVKIDYEDPENPETAILTVPDYDIFVTAEYEDVIVDPGTSDTDYGGDIAAGVVIGGIAAVGAYEVGTGLYRITQMDDVAMPANRLALAKLLWERAGKPEPEGTALYSDISAEDTDAQKAARWAVEQELLKDDDSVEGELKFHPAFPVSKLRVCLTWEKAKQKGLFDQNNEA